MRNSAPLLILALLVSFLSQSQNIESLADKTERYLERYPQQKVYLHLDKDEYFTGDNIWFKAYVINAHNHLPDTAETTLFTELFDTKGLLVKKEIIRLERGNGKGDFSLPDSIAEGNYLIRAYTPWMLNFDESYIYSRNIFVQNPESKNYINRRTRSENRRFNRELENMREEYSFEIFSESGNLVYGLKNRIAYHASNSLGEGIVVDAKLINSAGTVSATHESVNGLKGKGVFEFVPERDERYSIVVDYPKGRNRSYPVRNISNEGYVLRVDETDDVFRISVNNNVPGSDKIYMVLHTRGIIHKFTTFDDKNYSFDMNKSELPQGISVVSLFDSNAKVISERLFFNFAGYENDLSLTTVSGPNRIIEIQINSPYHLSDTSSFSISVTGAGPEFRSESKENILSGLYLTSDLTGITENPAWYFREIDSKRKAMDLLMLTSSWERIQFDKILNEEYPGITFRRLDGFPLFGNIEPTEESKEFDRYSFELTLQVDDEMLVRSTRTNRVGDFKFDSLKVHGEFNARITILGLQSSKPGYIELFPEKLDGSELGINLNFKELLQNRGSNWVRIPTELRRPTDRRRKIRDNLPYHYGSADQVIYLRENDERYRSMRDVLSTRVSGLSIEGNSIIMRGPSSLIMSNQPLLLVDGQRYNSFQFLNLSPVEISHVEVFKGTSASIFGIRGANGAIVAHTRRSSIQQELIFEYIISGYYFPKDFSEAKEAGVDNISKYENYRHTIYWNAYPELDENGRKTISIQAPEGVKVVDIILEGVDQMGRIFHRHSQLEL
ncbi:MAG: TonB-dependent receptor plug domain-containing protein [Bacteroidales bacterium]|nr:TonB-dependent receptor plug domain-containing protein [Bacteroidales bacterium]